jgi:hypothetical protein
VALSNDAVVVRGGSATLYSEVAEHIKIAVRDVGEPVLSVYADERHGSETEAQAAQRIAWQGRIAHRKIRFTTLSKLTAVRLQLADEREPGDSELHYNIYFKHTSSTPPTKERSWLGYRFSRGPCAGSTKMVDVLEVDFNNVTADGHIKTRVSEGVHLGQRLVVVDVVERESLDGTVLSIVEGRAIIDVGGGRVAPQPLGILYRPLWETRQPTVPGRAIHQMVSGWTGNVTRPANSAEAAPLSLMAR